MPTRALEAFETSIPFPRKAHDFGMATFPTVGNVDSQLDRTQFGFDWEFDSFLSPTERRGLGWMERKQPQWTMQVAPLGHATMRRQE